VILLRHQKKDPSVQSIKKAEQSFPRPFGFIKNLFFTP
jgi:hypothetical protein